MKYIQTTDANDVNRWEQISIYDIAFFMIHHGHVMQDDVIHFVESIALAMDLEWDKEKLIADLNKGRE